MQVVVGGPDDYLHPAVPAIPGGPRYEVRPVYCVVAVLVCCRWRRLVCGLVPMRHQGLAGPNRGSDFDG